MRDRVVLEETEPNIVISDIRGLRIEMDPKCKATLYSDPGFKGHRVRIYSSETFPAFVNTSHD